MKTTGGRYARRTSVPVKRTKAELESLVEKYGATSFVSGWNDEGRGMVGFKMDGRNVRFLMPSLADGYGTTTTQREQAHRSAWRSLLLLVKAKLEAVDAGFTVFEEEFLPHIVTSSGMTVYEHMERHQLLKGDGPLMLPADIPSVVDAEVVS